MLSKSFKSGKCKTSLKLGISRIKLLKNRRDIQVKQLKRELAQLLETGQEQTARIRVEHVIREEKTMSAYDLIEIYCELIVARMPIIESQKSCPIDLKEAICSVIFASPRCADIPELNDVRKQFAAKYGKEFVTSALELRSDSGVNRMIVEKLSAKTPDIETKMKTLTAIAKEHDIKWDSKAFEELQKPKEDLLNGSSSFAGANKLSMEPLNANFSPNTSSFHSSSQANLSAASLASTPFPNESRESDGKTRESEANYSHPKEEAAGSFKQPTWKMEFKDAASAAQAAAESAERASIAARAAAELASQENISRQNSNEPNGLSFHSGRDQKVLRGEFNESVNAESRDEISHHSSSSDDDDDGMDNVREMGSSRKRTHQVDRSESAASASFDWIIPPIEQHQTSHHGDLDAGEKLFRYEHDSGDYPAAVFDEYDDPEPTENLFDSFEKRQNDQPSPFAPSTSSINSGHESRPPAAVEKLPSSKFDESDGLTSESDGDTSGSWRNGTSRISNLQLEKNGLGREELLQTSSSAEEAKRLQASSSSSVGAGDPEAPDEELAIGGEIGLKFGRLTGGLRNRGYIRPPYTASSAVDSPVSSLETLGSTISSTNQIPNKAKGSLSEESNQGSRRKKTFSTDKSEEDDDTTVFNQEKSRRYRGSDNASTVSEGIDQKIYKEPSSRMSKADFDSDSDVEERDSPVNMENQAIAGSSSTAFKLLSRRTNKEFTSKGPNLPRSTESRRPSQWSSAPEPPSQTADSATIGRGKQNRRSSKPNSSAAESMPELSVNEEEKKIAGGIPDPDSTSSVNSGSNEPSDSSGGGTKLQQAASQRASHVHPKLPDYETLAAHFQSLRSNRR